MGYRHKARAVTCGHCKRRVAWFVDVTEKMSSSWRCECGALNRLRPMPEWPHVPPSLYIGPDKHARFKVYAVPPGVEGQDWTQPYSVRSFAYQASDKFGGCAYRPSRRGMVMGEPVFNDHCYDSAREADYEEYSVPRVPPSERMDERPGNLRIVAAHCSAV